MIVRVRSNVFEGVECLLFRLFLILLASFAAPVANSVACKMLVSKKLCRNVVCTSCLGLY